MSSERPVLSIDSFGLHLTLSMSCSLDKQTLECVMHDAHSHNNVPQHRSLQPLTSGDSHADCQQAGLGLMCYQRSGGDPVPGCVGGESDSSSTDYCTLPALNDIGNGLSAGSYELCQVRSRHRKSENIDSLRTLLISCICSSFSIILYLVVIMANRAIATQTRTVLARMFATRGTDTTLSQDVKVLVRHNRGF